MKRLQRIATLTALVIMLGSCGFPLAYLQNQQKAEEGVGQIVNQLPRSPDFELIKIVQIKMDPVYDTEIGEPCYYGRAYAIFGSSLSEAEALEAYSGKLEASGWQPEGKQHETGRKLVRGSNELAEVYYGNPGVDIERALDYTKVRQTYRSLLFVLVDYMVPHRQGC